MRRPLRFGYTTGACAAAAAKGAALMLRDQQQVETVALALPTGIMATFTLCGQNFNDHSAACCVVKDAGDDPDVTNGCELWAEVTLSPASPVEQGGGIVVEGGTGIVITSYSIHYTKLYEFSYYNAESPIENT